MLHGRARAAAGAIGLAWLLSWLYKSKGSAKQQKKHKVRVLARGRSIKGVSDKLSIVSYNLLQQAYATSDRFPHVHPSYILSWEYRWPRLQRELSSYEADIVCCQECTHEK
jgi:mRNA deadenylase 3'-5' endonuclease subunit Ccr4